MGPSVVAPGGFRGRGLLGKETMYMSGDRLIPKYSTPQVAPFPPSQAVQLPMPPTSPIQPPQASQHLLPPAAPFPPFQPPQASQHIAPPAAPFPPFQPPQASQHVVPPDATFPSFQPSSDTPTPPSQAAPQAAPTSSFVPVKLEMHRKKLAVRKQPMLRARLQQATQSSTETGTQSSTESTHRFETLAKKTLEAIDEQLAVARKRDTGV